MKPAMRAFDSWLALALVLSAWCTAPVPAQTPPPDDGRFLFGTVGIARGQAARLSVAEVSPPPDDGAPDDGVPPPDDGRPPPYDVVLAFVDAAGALVVDSAGNPVRRKVTLTAGQIAWLDLPARDVVGGEAIRAQVRPVVLIRGGSGGEVGGIAPCVVPVLEVLSRLTGRTQLHYANARFQPPPDDDTPPPDDSQPPPDDGRFLFGSVGLARGQVARLSVAVAAPPPDGAPHDGAPPPDDGLPQRYDVVLAFVDAAGVPIADAAGNLVRRKVTLAGGQAAWLDLDARDVLRGTALREQVRPVVQVSGVIGDDVGGIAPCTVPTLEVFGRLTGLTEAFYADPRFEPTRLPVIAFPSPRFPTLQAAVDAVSDGGVLSIAAGTHEVSAPVIVRAKRIAVRGPGLRAGAVARLRAARPRGVVEAERAAGVLHFLDAGGSVEGLEIEGGDACIVTAGSAGAPPLALRDMTLQKTGRGILALGPGSLSLESVQIQNCLWNGISFAPQFPAAGIKPLLSVVDALLADADNFGIYVKDATYIGANVFAAGCKGGGMAAIRSGVLAVDHLMVANHGFGIVLVESTGTIADSLIVDTLALPDGKYGDGVSFRHCPSAFLDQNEIENSARAAVSLFGSSADLRDNSLVCQTFDIVVDMLEGVASFADDLGGNQCGCPGTSLGACDAVSSGVSAPAPLGELE